LISACATLAREGAEPIDLIIIGDGPARAALEQHAKTEFPSTRFVGHCAGDSLRNVLASAELFVMPGMGGLAIQEAMASALPVIVAEGDGTQMDLVRPGNGWNVATDSLAGLVDAMRDAVSDIPRLRQMGAESFRIVNEEINLESMVDAYIDAVCALASHNGEITH
jgi:glycosyltransferase involved in cell wall biosynthesis